MNIIEECLKQCKGDRIKEREVVKNVLKVAILQRMVMCPVKQWKPHDFMMVFNKFGVKEGNELIRDLMKKY